MIIKILRYLIFFLKRFFIVLWRVTLKLLKQIAGAVVFAILAAMELGDWTGLLARYGNPEKDAAALGITTQASTTHLMIMIVLSISIVLMALITVVGLFQDSHWIIRTSQITGGLFGLYGAYQIFSALTMATKGKEGLLLGGTVFIILGLAVFGLGGKFVHAHPTSRPTSQQISR